MALVGSLALSSGCVEVGEEPEPEPSMFEERCAVLCDVEDTACDPEDQTWCETLCVARTEALPFTCGVCVIDNSRGYAGGCDDPLFGRISDPECLTSCAEIPEQDLAWDDRCLLLCSPDSLCEGAEDQRCFDECMVQTSGLSTACASCLLDGSFYPSNYGCEVHIPTISDEACASYCVAG